MSTDTVAHEMLMRHHKEMDSWHTECSGHPDWISRPERTEREAEQRYLDHVTGVQRGPRHESQLIAEYTDNLIPAPLAGPRHAAPRRRMNVERILGRVVAPALGVATLAFGLWAGVVSG